MQIDAQILRDVLIVLGLVGYIVRATVWKTKVDAKIEQLEKMENTVDMGFVAMRMLIEHKAEVAGEEHRSLVNEMAEGRRGVYEKLDRLSAEVHTLKGRMAPRGSTQEND